MSHFGKFLSNFDMATRADAIVRHFVSLRNAPIPRKQRLFHTLVNVQLNKEKVHNFVFSIKART